MAHKRVHAYIVQREYSVKCVKLSRENELNILTGPHRSEQARSGQSSWVRKGILTYVYSGYTRRTRHAKLIFFVVHSCFFAFNHPYITVGDAQLLH